ncbi:PRC-barrel domain-containing protein [Streptacidiphilus neutrinimicus]|uniref:PRC-barrel domain-containing protein n=1 Tax=Streptacidiphilus neutrinimicus TaxID=105420 RepID=UPI0005A7F352|nr:PRC-barrel domain-containing protein [Streptacidiphilus neutrinimicus]
MKDFWGYRPAARHTAGTDLTGYQVDAIDGRVGKVDEATDEAGAAFIVVNCKPWLFGKHVMLPAGTVILVDGGREKIRVALTKDQIRNAPAYEPAAHRDDTRYRTTLSTY